MARGAPTDRLTQVALALLPWLNERCGKTHTNTPQSSSNSRYSRSRIPPFTSCVNRSSSPLARSLPRSLRDAVDGQEGFHGSGPRPRQKQRREGDDESLSPLGKGMADAFRKRAAREKGWWTKEASGQSRGRGLSSVNRVLTQSLSCAKQP